MPLIVCRSLFVLLVAAVTLIVTADVNAAPEDSSHEQVIRSLAERVTQTMDPQQVLSLKPSEAIPLLTPEQRRILGEGYVTFRINVPAIITLLRPSTTPDEPFWLAERGFEPTAQVVEVGEQTYEAFERRFEAGEVSLGIGSLDHRLYPYFLAVKAAEPGEELKVSALSPAQMKVDTLTAEVQPFVDQANRVISKVSPELAGRTLIRTSRNHIRSVALLHRFKATKYPSSDKPDHIVLTWSDDPRTTVTVQWRTSPSVQQGRVRYRRQGDASAGTAITAETRPLSTPSIVNDPLIHLHAATLTGLSPDTAYEYSLGDATGDRWTDWTGFSTAPAVASDFTFTYLGDAQQGFDKWGGTLGRAFANYPESAFYILAGDLVDRGHDRDDWDAFFHAAADVFDRRVFVPVIGNHEVHGGKPPTLYLSFFKLPQAGPEGVEPERAYAFEYGNALVIVLDSNLDPELQTRWLDEQLARSQAKWKFVSFHHPVYVSHPQRNHDHLLNAWTPIFDKHGVDMVLQGHDHAYLRTHAMYGNERVDMNPTIRQRGTYYVVSVSGTRVWPQAKGRDYTAVAFERTPTYQIIRIQVGDDRLHYRAFDDAGNVRDELVIDKSASATAASQPVGAAGKQP